MAPKDFIEARSKDECTIVANKPYYPNLHVDGNDHNSIISATIQIIFHSDNNDFDEETKNAIIETNKSDLQDKLNVKIITGGITNALYCISGFSSLVQSSSYDSVLVRVFGAEGMIDRDVETSSFAALAECGVAPPYHGRFKNGRVEGWLDNYFALTLPDLPLSLEEIAVQMAKLHYGFSVPDDLKEWHNEEEPGLWGQLFSWMDQAKKTVSYKTQGDDDRAKSLLDLDLMEKELIFQKSAVPKDAKVAFCHNDLLAGNIMKHASTGQIKLIDFEYGGVNFIGFDIANHLNEWAGGTENKAGKPDYDLLPVEKQQRAFVTSYVRYAREISSTSSSQSSSQPDKNDSANTPEDDVKSNNGSSLTEEEEIESLSAEVSAFLLVNHLYWGMWAVNQAATEGTEEFDYMAYAVHRFAKYFDTKPCN